jgi:DNA-binding beta-propeller fold protein YncE
MRIVRTVLIGASAFAAALVSSSSEITEATQRAARIAAAPFQVDPLWPKPLPNHWLFGSITGVAVDAQDHIWVVHRGGDSMNARTEIGLASNPPTAESCCAPAPQVLQFDTSGRLVSHWGGSGDGYDWPRSPGSVTVDAKGNVWITAAGITEPPPTSRSGRNATAAATAPAVPVTPPKQDSHIIKFTRDGKFLMQIGKAGEPGANDSKTALNRPAAVAVDAAANEVYVADGFANRRIVVFDADTGAYKRHWGAYGKPPSDADPGEYRPSDPPAQQFRSVSCVEISKDGLVYVCDRKNDRLQVFRKDGTFVKEAFIQKETRGEGSVWDVAFSPDPQQRQLYVADGQDQRVFVLDRETLTIVSAIGGGGRWPGAFFGVGSVAVDSRGNVYTGENFEGKRLQKFITR